MHCITGLETGGAERALYNLLSDGLAQCFENVVVSLTSEGVYGSAIRELGVTVRCLGLRRGVPSFGSLVAFCKVLTKYSPDILQGWMYHGNLAASLARLVAPGKPAVVWNVRHCLYALDHERLLTQQVIRVNRLLSPYVNMIVYNSRVSRDQHEELGFAPEGGKIIPNGFNIVKLYPDREVKKKVRSKLNLPEQGCVIGHVARFHPMKDHASFLRSVVSVVNQRKNVYVLLVGRNVSPDNPALDGIVPERLLERFRFVGERSDVADLMQTMDVFCQSSWSEAFPNVLGEAMSLGIPCVATDVGDSRNVVGEAGIIVPPFNTKELELALMEMLDKLPEERARLGKSARRRIEENYSLPCIVEQYLNLYQHLLKGGRESVC